MYNILLMYTKLGHLICKTCIEKPSIKSAELKPCSPILYENM